MPSTCARTLRPPRELLLSTTSAHTWGGACVGVFGGYNFEQLALDVVLNNSGFNSAPRTPPKDGTACPCCRLALVSALGG